MLQNLPLRGPSGNRETSNLDKYCTARRTTTRWDEYLTKSAAISLYTEIRLVRQFGRYSTASACTGTTAEQHSRSHQHSSPLSCLSASTSTHTIASAVTSTATTIVVHHHRHYHYLHHRRQPPPPSPPRSPSTGAREAKGPEVSALRVSWPTWAARAGAPRVYPLLTANPETRTLVILGRARAPVPPVKHIREGWKRQFVPVGRDFWRSNYISGSSFWTVWISFRRRGIGMLLTLVRIGGRIRERRSMWNSLSLDWRTNMYLVASAMKKWRYARCNELAAMITPVSVQWG